MKLFGCESCGQVTFFENSLCIKCGHRLAFDPSCGQLRTLAPDSHAEELHLLGDGGLATYHACANAELAGCNWLVAISDAQTLCVCCRLNRTIPNLANDNAVQGWRKIEVAKRRLVYTALALGLPINAKTEACPQGLAFDILQPLAGQTVTTGHSDGVITLNLEEADDPFREQVRVNLGEPYRTLLGHLRHEVGHYYWDRLIAGHDDRLVQFRKVFGDEQASYDEALARHYDGGAAPNWGERFVSAYASMHPWEDWAETWAHYLHMIDTMETAHAYGVRLNPKPEAPGPVIRDSLKLKPRPITTFDQLVSDWYPLTFALNSLNRSMGHADWYPFVLSDPALEKLRMVHDLVLARVE